MLRSCLGQVMTGQFSAILAMSNRAAFYSSADCFDLHCGALAPDLIGAFLSPFPLLLSSCQNLKVKSTKDCKDHSAKNSLESE